MSGLIRCVVAAAIVILGTLVATSQAIELPRAVPSFNQAYADGPGAWGACARGNSG